MKKDSIACCKKPGALSGLFRKCATCAGSGAGGFFVGHAGCIITPAVLAVSGATAATGGLSILMLAFSAATTAGGLYAWYKLRGKDAGKTEKKIVFGSALAGLALSAGLHFSRAGEETSCCTPQNSAPALHCPP